MKTTLGFLVDEEVKIVAEIDVVEVIINGFEVLPSQVRNKKDSLGSLYIYTYIIWFYCTHFSLLSPRSNLSTVCLRDSQTLHQSFL